MGAVGRENAMANAVAAQAIERGFRPPKPYVLVVEDDPSVAKLLRSFLESEGYGICSAGTVAAMRIAIEHAKIDLVILDVGLPDEDGWSALRWLRARSAVPIIMLSGKVETVDKIAGLELGADDYVGKPFDLHELLARLRCILRRTERSSPPERATDDALRFATWVLDLSNEELRTEAGETVHLTQAEYRILVMLAQNPRKVISRDRLLDGMAGREWGPYDRSIDVHISNLRRKLDCKAAGPSLIRTVRGSGYMLIPNRRDDGGIAPD
jgi:two-component system, OmpR family, response regulator